MNDATILVADDEAGQRELLVGHLRHLGYEVLEAADGLEATERVGRGGVDLVLLDQRMPRLGGADAVRAVKAADPAVDVVVVTAFGTVETAVEALKLGAVDYLTKPLDLDRLAMVVNQSLVRRTLVRENRELREKLAGGPSFRGIVGGTGAMQELLSTVARVAATEATILLTGESGTGKELIARALHGASRRAEGPFVPVHCAALAETLLESELFGHERGAFTGADRQRIGRFEAASGGTVFLDEIAEIPPQIQVKLLRVIQERQIERVGGNRPVPLDVRLVAATNRELDEEIRARRFREDLYYRLAVVSLRVPPLRERRADIPPLVEHFLQKHAGEGRHSIRGLSREAHDLLLRYDWPGNVRELENVVQRAIVLARGGVLSTDDLPPAIRAAAEEGGSAVSGGTGLHDRIEDLERQLIREALDSEHGVQYRAAERLGISERTLRYKLEKLGMR